MSSGRCIWGLVCVPRPTRPFCGGPVPVRVLIVCSIICRCRWCLTVLPAKRAFFPKQCGTLRGSYGKSRAKVQISVPLVFHCAGPQKTRLRRSKFAFRARNVGPENFLASRCSAVAIFVPLVVTPCASTWYGHKTCLGRSNLRFACAGLQKMRLSRSKFAFRLRETLGLTVFSAQNASPEVKIWVSLAQG